MMPRIKRFLYENGGPIIMVQVENEYGASACDHKYLEWMRDETSSYVDDKAVLISNDIDFDNDIKCGTIQNVLEGSNFGVGKFSIFITFIFLKFGRQRKVQMILYKSMKMSLGVSTVVGQHFENINGTGLCTTANFIRDGRHIGKH